MLLFLNSVYGLMT